MPAKGNPHFSKPSPWADHGPKYNNRTTRLRAIHPIIASEESDDSGGGAPLWTPVSAEFSDTATTTAILAEGVVKAPFQQSEVAVFNEMSDFDQSEQDHKIASTTTTEQENTPLMMDPERVPIKHRHSLGSSLSALTAPFIPTASSNTLQDEVITIADQRGPKQGPGGIANTQSHFLSTRPGSKSFHHGADTPRKEIPPFPFTKRPSIPELKELMAKRATNQQKKEDEVGLIVVGREHNRSTTNNVNVYYQPEIIPNGSTSQALVVHEVRHFQPVEHRLRIFATPSEETKRNRSDALNWLTSRGIPLEKDLLDPNYLPFMETAFQHRPADYAVVQVANIPYGVSRSEIANLMGRNCRRIADNLEGIHIIMTRIDGKTHDAYVEFENLTAAMNVVNRLEARGNSNGIGANSNSSIMRSSRLGDRQVSVNLSTQGALMKALFPNARGVSWESGRPQFPFQSSEEPWKHFKGFMTLEELSMLVKHVEFPQRASFSTNCPERPYESFISVLKKFPWNETQCITIHMQYVMYDTARRLLEILQDRTDRSDASTSGRLTQLLLKRFVATCLLCPGFTVLQKDNILATAGMDLDEFPNLPLTQPRFADGWRHQYALSPTPGVPQDVLEFYIGIIREETYSVVNDLPPEERRRLAARANSTSDYWGYFWLEVGFPSAPEDNRNGYYGQGGGCGGGPPASLFDRLTLAEAAQLEWAAIDHILRRALVPVPHQPQHQPRLMQ